MEGTRDILPLSAFLIIFLFMGYTDLFIIGEPSRLSSFIPMIVVITIWAAAVLKSRRTGHVH
jgi:hypothetical protein